MQLQLSGIKNIIFDLGKVIVNLDFDASIRAFHNLGLAYHVLTPQQSYRDPVFYQFEVGLISANGFRQRVRELLNNPKVSDTEIDAAWQAMIRDVPPGRVEVLRQLSGRYRLFLFSNTNSIHIDYFLRTFKGNYGFHFESLFEKVFYSHELKARKPDPEAFRQVLALAGINAGCTLFVDDLEKNIDAANQAGLKGFWLKEGLEMADLF